MEEKKREKFLQWDYNLHCCSCLNVTAASLITHSLCLLRCLLTKIEHFLHVAPEPAEPKHQSHWRGALISVIDVFPPCLLCFFHCKQAKLTTLRALTEPAHPLFKTKFFIVERTWVLWLSGCRRMTALKSVTRQEYTPWRVAAFTSLQ